MDSKQTYVPVACGFVDEIEVAIIQRRTGTLRFLSEGKEIVLENARLVDWKTEKGAEFAFTATGEKIRLDAILDLFGKPNPGYC